MARDQIIPHGEVLVTNTPGFPSDTPHQPGGVFSGFVGELYPRYDKYDRDHMERWHYHQFYGKDRDLRIYTIYRVNPNSNSTAGDTTAGTQQQIYMDRDGDTRNPRQAIVQDFLCELEQVLESKMTVIVLVGDINEGINGVEKSNQQFHDIGLINLIEEDVGEQKLPRTCRRGRNVIDRIWVKVNVVFYGTIKT